MRNPLIAERFVEAVFNMHTKSGIAEAMEEIIPLDSTSLGVEIAIEKWGPATIERLAKIRAKLNPEKPDHAFILDTTKLLEETFLAPGYQDVMRGLFSRD